MLYSFKIRMIPVFFVLTYIVVASSAILASPVDLASHSNSPQELEIQLSKSAIKIQEPESTDPIRASFENLCVEDKISFYTNRKIFLTQAARGLQVLRYGFGIGSLVKEKLSFQIRKIQEDLQSDDISRMPETVQKDILVAREQEMIRKLEDQDTVIRKTLAQRSEDVLAHFLKAIDRKLWQQALLFSHSNEFGFIGSVGLQGVAGMASRGGIGGFLELGISIGYNRETKSLAFQIFRNIENFHETPMRILFIAGVSARGGFYIANQKTGELSYKGTSFYPRVIPGYSSFTERSFSTGPFTGLTIPPAPITDIFTYTNRLDQGVIVRVTISPLLKSFVKMEFGFNSLKFIVAPVLAAVGMIHDLVMGVKRCETVLL